MLEEDTWREFASITQISDTLMRSDDCTWDWLDVESDGIKQPTIIIRLPSVGCSRMCRSMRLGMCRRALSVRACVRVYAPVL